MSERYLGESICNLGFGLMRLPELPNGDIDIERTKGLVDMFIAGGGSYFDTAYVYNDGQSEAAAKLALVDRYPREKFQLATKLALRLITKKEQIAEQFNTQLERTGAGYFDFYLIHGMGAKANETAEELGVWEFLAEQKEKGLIKHIGFSCHDQPEGLDEILTKHPEAEFVQLQINYIDWNSPKVRAKECYEVARKHGKPVIIMEPLKGGTLASEANDLKTIFRSVDPDKTVASWALRYAASLDGLVTVLSGMSTEEQVRDNIATISDFHPISADDQKVIDRAIEYLNSIDTIPCTGCRYCVDGCPQKISIPTMISLYNNYLVYSSAETQMRSFKMNTKGRGLPSDCIECRACEGVCPQHLEIVDYLKQAASVFEPLL